MSYYSQLHVGKKITVADGTHEMNMANVIQSFHDSFAGIKCGPEYICTCCDQLWYQSSVTKCDDNKYFTPSAQKSNVCMYM